MALPAPGAVAFALSSAVLWGLSPVFTKKGIERGGTSVQAVMVVMLTSGALFWTALLATNRTAAFAGMSFGDAGIFLIGGVIGTTVGRLGHYAGIDRIGASVATAAMNTRPLFAVGLAVLFLGETVTAITGVGVLLLVGGVMLLSVAKGGDIRGWRSRDLAFPLAAGLAYGTGNVIRRYGFLETPATTIEALALNETAAILTLGSYLLISHRDRIRAADSAPIPYFIMAGIISTGGLFSLFQALSIGRVTVVDPVSAMAPLFSALFTYLFLRDVERVTHGVIVGAMLVVFGGALVTVY
ncbi:DMT family transporter [Halobellus captivus]|uniref:DMT family transporter n=1 Tax=Halobellus captivus TaxID=2592614 RepID=UPI0011A72B69|nr:DMT family transporter [Halobellus captivus]